MGKGICVSAGKRFVVDLYSGKVGSNTGKKGTHLVREREMITMMMRTKKKNKHRTENKSQDFVCCTLGYLGECTLVPDCLLSFLFFLLVFYIYLPHRL